MPVDYSNQDITNTNLTGADLSGGNFTNTIATGVNFTNAIITNAVFKNTLITGANISTLTFSDLQKGYLLLRALNHTITAVNNLTALTPTQFRIIQPAVSLDTINMIQTVTVKIPNTLSNGNYTIVVSPLISQIVCIFVATNQNIVIATSSGNVRTIRSNGTVVQDVDNANATLSLLKVGSVSYSLTAANGDGVIVMIPVNFNVYQVNGSGLGDVITLTLGGAVGNGATGPTGAAGAAGSTGPTGPGGVAGAAGAAGVAGSIGPTGPGGAAGSAGAAGVAGSIGPTGPGGAAGSAGAAGAAGAAGSTGPTGVGGVAGTIGPTGPAGSVGGGGGSTGPTGVTGPAPAINIVALSAYASVRTAGYSLTGGTVAVTLNSVTRRLIPFQNILVNTNSLFIKDAGNTYFTLPYTGTYRVNLNGIVNNSTTVLADIILCNNSSPPTTAYALTRFSAGNDINNTYGIGTASQVFSATEGQKLAVALIVGTLWAGMDSTALWPSGPDILPQLNIELIGGNGPTGPGSAAGSTGPTGSTGVTGTTGPTGVTGPAPTFSTTLEDRNLTNGNFNGFLTNAYFTNTQSWDFNNYDYVVLFEYRQTASLGNTHLRYSWFDDVTPERYYYLSMDTIDGVYASNETNEPIIVFLNGITSSTGPMDINHYIKITFTRPKFSTNTILGNVEHTSTARDASGNPSRSYKSLASVAYSSSSVTTGVLSSRLVFYNDASGGAVASQGYCKIMRKPRAESGGEFQTIGSTGPTGMTGPAPAINIVAFSAYSSVAAAGYGPTANLIATSINATTRYLIPFQNTTVNSNSVFTIDANKTFITLPTTGTYRVVFNGVTTSSTYVAVEVILCLSSTLASGAINLMRPFSGGGTSTNVTGSTVFTATAGQRVTFAASVGTLYAAQSSPDTGPESLPQINIELIGGNGPTGAAGPTGPAGSTPTLSNVLTTGNIANTTINMNTNSIIGITALNASSGSNWNVRDLSGGTNITISNSTGIYTLNVPDRLSYNWDNNIYSGSIAPVVYFNPTLTQSLDLNTYSYEVAIDCYMNANPESWIALGFNEVVNNSSQDAQHYAINFGYYGTPAPSITTEYYQHNTYVNIAKDVYVGEKQIRFILEKYIDPKNGVKGVRAVGTYDSFSKTDATTANAVTGNKQFFTKYVVGMPFISTVIDNAQTTSIPQITYICLGTNNVACITHYRIRTRRYCQVASG